MRPLTVMLVAALALLSFAAPALGHARLLGSIPEAGATVTEPLDEVRLEFNEPVEADFGQLQVVDPDGNRVDASPPVGDGPIVTAELDELTVAGEHTVAWRVISADGHPIEGTFAFEVAEEALAADAEPATEPTPDAPAATPDPQPTPEATTETAPTPNVEPTPEEAAAVDENGTAGTGLLIGLVAVVAALVAGAALLLRSGRETDAPE